MSLHKTYLELWQLENWYQSFPSYSRLFIVKYNDTTTVWELEETLKWRYLYDIVYCCTSAVNNKEQCYIFGDLLVNFKSSTSKKTTIFFILKVHMTMLTIWKRYSQRAPSRPLHFDEVAPHGYSTLLSLLNW